jgi:hypothetical protein
MKRHIYLILCIPPDNRGAWAVGNYVYFSKKDALDALKYEFPDQNRNRLKVVRADYLEPKIPKTEKRI